MNQSLSLHRFFQASREPIMALTEQYFAIPFPRRIGMPASRSPPTKRTWILPSDPTMKTNQNLIPVCADRVENICQTCSGSRLVQKDQKG